MMPRTRPYARSLLALLLVAACFAAMVVPLLEPARAAQPRISSAAPGNLIISSFRFTGPSGISDEFIELFNRDCTNPIDLSTYTIRASDGQGGFSTLFPPSGFTGQIAAGHYFLLANNTNPGGYSDEATVPADATYTSVGISSASGGVAVFNAANAVVDQVGFSSSTDGYFEGQPIGAIAGNKSQGTRKVSASGSFAGSYVDSNNNLRDFVMDVPQAPHNSQSTGGTCDIPTQKISGNTDVGGVALTYRDIDNSPQIVTSDANGDYTITIPSNWAGTITPVLTGYSFSPASRSYNNNPVLSDLTGQNFTASQSTPSTRDVVINEIAWSGTTAAPEDEWIELYNTRPYDIDLTNWTLSDTESSMGTDGILTFTKADSPDGKTVPVIKAHGFFVIASSSGVFRNLTANYIDPNLALPTCNPASYCGDRLFLNLPSPTSGILGEQIDTANYYSYHWLAGSENGHRSMERGGPNGPVPDSYTAWLTFVGSPPPPGCTAHPNVRDRDGNKINGTPGCPNWASVVTPTPLPTATTYHYKTATPYPPTPYGHMVINEFLPRAGYDWNQDGVVDVYDEFVELKNLGPVAAQLNNWRIDIISPGGPSSYALTGITLQPGQRIMFYSSKSHLSLWDSGGTVRLINNRSIVVDARSYEPVGSPDQSTCRIPDGNYWRFPCFPTPGLENSLTGTLPVPPPVIASKPPPCLLADTIPDPFKEAECYGYGGNVYNPAYWDSQAGFSSFPVPDMYNKDDSVVK